MIKIKMRKKIILVIANTLLLLFVLFPFFWMFKTSIEPTTEVYGLPLTWFPSQPTLAHYAETINLVNIPLHMLNSLFVAGFNTIIAVSVTSCAGYALGRFSFRGNRPFSIYLIVTNLMPGIVSIIPFYFFMRDIGLYNTYWALILAYLFWSLPFCTLMLRSYFKSSFPNEVHDSGLVDGCSEFSTFWRLCVPVSWPGIAAAGIFSFILGWNEFFWASIMLTNASMATMPLALADFIGEMGRNPYVAQFMAAGVLVTIPAIILFAFLQKYFVMGLTMGSVKG
ncbi:MAG: carbohydrate ABC transporter permease [Nitrososphaeria archaeon]|jgi:ABC-type glycerol-3-phosphate transport system permease component